MVWMSHHSETLIFYLRKFLQFLENFVWFMIPKAEMFCTLAPLSSSLHSLFYSPFLLPSFSFFLFLFFLFFFFTLFLARRHILTSISPKKSFKKICALIMYKNIVNGGKKNHQSYRSLIPFLMQPQLLGFG